jgi:8-oxo-dGTP diphosphatase
MIRVPAAAARSIRSAMADEVTLQVGVKVILQNSKGEYLLLHRSPEKYPGVKGRWDIVGGRIDAGATLMDNLKREVEEETGLKLESEPALVAAQDIITPSGDRHVVRLTYFGEIDGEIHLDGDEHDTYKWYSWEELINLDSIDVYLKELLDNGVIKN